MKKQKKHLYTCAVLLCAVMAQAQTQEGNFQYRADDTWTRIPVTFIPAEEEPAETVWNLSGMDVSGNRREVRLEAADSTGGIAVTENRTRYLYRQAPDSLLLTGYENRNVLAEYDAPKLLLRIPLTMGATYESDYHGTAAHGEKLFMRVFGHCRAEVDAEGMMILPQGDTLRQVTRVHLHDISAEQHCPGIRTWQALRQLADSIAPYTADSVRLYMTDGRPLTVTDTYQWYATGYRYPVLEAVIIKDGQTVEYAQSYYGDPHCQQLLSDEENETLRGELAAAEHQDDPHHSAAQNVNIGINGTTLTVSYDLTEDARVTALLSSVGSIVYRQQAQTGQAGDACQMTLSCDGLLPGQYLLYLNVNNTVTSYTVTLK